MAFLIKEILPENFVTFNICESGSQVKHLAVGQPRSKLLALPVNIIIRKE